MATDLGRYAKIAEGMMLVIPGPDSGTRNDEGLRQLSVAEMFPKLKRKL